MTDPTQTRSSFVLIRRVMLVALVGIAIAVIPDVAVAQQPFSDLVAQEAASDGAVLPPTAVTTQAGTVRSGQEGWNVSFSNNSESSVTNPTISVQSGYDPSQYNFTWQGQPLTAFPVTATQPSLGPGQAFGADLFSNVPVPFTLGYNSTRTVSPSKIRVGGTNQTVTMTISLIDSRYCLINTPDCTGGIMIWVGSNLSGVSLVSATNPNLKNGEILQTSVPPFALFQWEIIGSKLHKTYSFSATLHVPNSSGSSFVYRPVVMMQGLRTTSAPCPGSFMDNPCSGSSATITDATLDGGIPGSGSATYSVDEAGHTWTETHTDAYMIRYEGTN